MPNAATRPVGLLVAVLATWVSSVVFVGVGIGALMQSHGRFSVGVGAMLFVYAGVVAWIGYLAWLRRWYARGLLVGSALLHLAVIAGSDRGGPAILWVLAALPPLAALVTGLLPSTTAALGIDR